MATAWDVIYYILLPFAWLLELVLFVLRILASPFLFIARICLHISSQLLSFVAQFEVNLHALKFKAGSNSCRRLVIFWALLQFLALASA